MINGYLLESAGGFEGDVLLSALKVNPTYPVYNEDGSYFQKSKDVRNPVAMIKLTDDKTQTDRVLANLDRYAWNMERTEI